uniref:ORF_01R n=1 Tax=Human herpesvirus 1 (strain R15) TaxID=36345 RepID=Q6VB67_HHV1R|nr:ORF_01R [Human alphaherpesvirus 1 strain R-15]
MASHYRPIRRFPLPFRMLTRNGQGAGPGPRLPGSAVMRYEPRAPVGRPRAPGPARRTPGPTGRRAAQGPPALPPPHWPAGGTAPRGRGRRVKEVRTRSVRTSSQYIYIIRAKCEHWRRARLRAGPGGGPGRRGAGLSGAHKGPARPTPADGAGHERRERLRSTRTGSGSRRGPSERTASASRRPGSGSGSHRKGTRGRGGGGKTRPPHPRNTGDAPRGPPTTETHRSAFLHG